MRRRRSVPSREGGISCGDTATLRKVSIDRKSASVRYIQVAEGVVLVRALSWVQHPALTPTWPSSRRPSRHLLRRSSHRWRRCSISPCCSKSISHGHIVIAGIPSAGNGGETVVIPWRCLVRVRVALLRGTLAARPKWIGNRRKVAPIEHDRVVVR